MYHNLYLIGHLDSLHSLLGISLIAHELAANLEMEK